MGEIAVGIGGVIEGFGAALGGTLQGAGNVIGGDGADDDAGLE